MKNKTVAIIGATVTFAAASLGLLVAPTATADPTDTRCSDTTTSPFCGTSSKADDPGFPGYDPTTGRYDDDTTGCVSYPIQGRFEDGTSRTFTAIDCPQ